MLVLNAVKKTTFLLLSGTILLSTSLPTLAMEEKSFADITHSATKPQLNGIEIPSKAEVVGVKAPEYSSKQVEDSWGDLSNFTEQTLRNFQQDPKNPRGILYVHSLEDIMGATECFTKLWNQNNYKDQRPEEGDFHQIFSHYEFVENYIDYVLAQRILISGSVLAFHENPRFNLRSTFSPVSFIFDVPKECVIVTSGDDAHTPVYYAPLNFYGYDIREETYTYARDNAPKRVTLDTLVRFPHIAKEAGAYYNNMNEVAILSCAQNEKNEFFRPKIVGVLINTSAPTPGSDYGNAERNEKWIEAAQTFSEVKNLPLLHLKEENLTTYNRKDAIALVKEWFGDETKTMYDYQYKRVEALTDKEKDKSQKFLLSNEQLDTYGLTRE